MSSRGHLPFLGLSSSPYKDISHVGFRAHPASMTSSSLDYICEVLFPSEVIFTGTRAWDWGAFCRGDTIHSRFVPNIAPDTLISIIVHLGYYIKIPFAWLAEATNTYFSQSQRLGRPRSRNQYIQCLGKAHFLVHSQSSLSAYAGRGQELSRVPFIRALTPFMRAPPS